MKGLLFINGEAPKTLPEFFGYDLIACTDGAFHYLKSLEFPLDKLDFVSGDFDSHIGSDDDLYQEKFIFTPDQDKTDFHKALELILEKGISEVDVYGASGGEQDHFLGNLNVAFSFKDKLEIKFYDAFSSYFFIPKSFAISNVNGKMISLMPFPVTEDIVTQGLKWPLNHEDLSLIGRVGTRNLAENETISIDYRNGELLIFIEN